MANDRNTLEQLEKIREFQIEDLKKSLELGKANFLVAVGCMNTIEFLGGVDNGELGQPGMVECRFRAGVRLLNGEYMNPPNCDEGIMYRLRNGLLHQYLPSLKGIREIKIINNPQYDWAIYRSQDKFKLNVARLVCDLEVAWQRILNELPANKTKFDLVRRRLAKLPKLL